MGTFERARARIGAARILLQELPLYSPQHRATSSLQSDALVVLLRSAACRKDLNAEQAATLSTQIHGAKFHAEHLSEILAELAGQRKKRRRDCQDATNAFEYFSADEWDSMTAQEHAGLIQAVVLDVVVGRMQCINPSEPTIKLLMSGILALSHGEDTLRNIRLSERMS